MAQPVAEIEGAAERVVENFRRLIALHGGAARPRTAAAALAGRMLFYSNRTLTAQLVDTLTRATPGEREQRISRLLELFNAHADWWDIDRIALLGVVNEIRLRLPAGHPLLLKLAAAAVYEEIDATQSLLAAAAPAHAPLIRFRSRLRKESLTRLSARGAVSFCSTTSTAVRCRRCRWRSRDC